MGSETRSSGRRAIRRPDVDKPVGLGEGQRPQDEGFYKAELAGRRADADPQRQDGHQRETRIEFEGADGVTKVLDHAAHGVLL